MRFLNERFEMLVRYASSSALRFCWIDGTIEKLEGSVGNEGSGKETGKNEVCNRNPRSS